jgi:hypothetical protein
VSPPSASDANPAVVRLYPIRSLVLGSDLAYRAHAFTVLGLLGPVGFARVDMADRDGSAEVLALVRAESPDVLVLDATGCEAAAARLIGAIARAAATVGVVVVCEHSTAAARQLGALPKWGWTEDLRSAVEFAFSAGSQPFRGGIAAADGPWPAGPLAGWADQGPPRSGQ